MPINVVIPMAGLGSRFPNHLYPQPKPLIPIKGVPMIAKAIQSLDFIKHDVDWHFIVAENTFTDDVIEVITNTLPKQPNIVKINYLTEGPACTALLLKNKLYNDDELIIANCDQIMEWNSDAFFVNARLYDGCMVTYHTDTEKNSFARLDESGFVSEVREKEVISNVSLNGIHYWKMGKYFVSSAEEMIAKGDRAPNGEFYIGPTYNHMISHGLKVGIYHIPNCQHHAVGVPIDLERYLTYVNSKHI